MPFPWLAFGIMMALSIGLSAIQYLLRPKPQKGDVFDSKTYHSDGMENSIEIGAPINVPCGVHKIAPQIRSYLSIAKGDDTTIEALCSCGEGVINGIHKVKLNNQSFGSLFGYNYHKNGKVKNGYWVTFGEKIQKVYESCKTVEYDLVGAISSGFNVTVKVNLDYSKEGKFQDASSDEPGYLIIYKKTGIDDNAEIVQYTGKSEAASGLLQFTGCRVTKSHADAEMVKQIYKIKKDSSGNVYETIPGFSKTVVNHQEVGTNVTKSNSVTVTTQNKVEALAVTVGFPEGLYTFDDKGGGYKKAEVTIKIRWWPDGEDWSGDETSVTTTRTQTSTNNHYIKLEKKKNYGYLVDSNGDYVEGTESELEQTTDWDEIEANDILEFTLGSTTYKCKVTKPAVKVPVDPPRYKWENVDGELQNNPVYRYKVNFKVQEPEQVDKYNGPKADKASYKFTYEETEKANVFKTTIAPDKAKLSDYRLTYVLPEMERFGALGYKKYKCQVFKLTDDMTNTEKGINKMTFIELQEITIDNLAYPHEALLALKFTTNEKIYGTINNITCITEGRLLKDVQNTSNPDRLSTNFYDFFADIITNKRYGRGKELNLSSAELTDFYSKLAPEAAFSDQSITENSKPRKRFEVNVNVDFKKPTIDLIQALSICARSNIYWDGVKPLAYVDRATTPTAMFGSGDIIPGSYRDQTMDLTDNVNRIYPQFLNKNKNYTHDSVARDLRDEGFTINKLRPKSISIYGITDKWRATKTANYLLRFAKYVQRGNQFQTGGDGITIDIGKTFYSINTKGNCGRILAVASNNITLDRAFTLESGKTYKALVRKDDGTPHTELTVDVGTTGLGSKTVIYFTTSISGVTLATNPIYGIGVSGEYYDTYRCVTKNSKGSSYEISGALYNAETYRLYKNDPSSDPSTNVDTEETESTPTTLDNKAMFPPNIISIKAVEDKNAMGQVSIYITKPISTIWSHAEVYISAEDDNIDQNVGRTTGEPLRITGLKPDIEYTIKAISYAGTISNQTPFESAPLTLEGTEPPRVAGLSIINNRGNETEMFGRDFRVRCAEMSGIKSDEFVRKEYVDEGLRYLWEVYYSGLPDSVKLGSIKANARKAYYETTRQNEFDFTLEENIEATKQLWKSYENVPNSSYATYYGNPQREILIKCWLINAWGRMSPAPAEITLTNPAPDMKDENGAVMTPTLRKIKNGHRITWKHPYREYDITDFIVFCTTDSAFTQNVKKYIVTSVITVNSTDEEVGDATYKIEVDGLDKKKTYYYKVVPRDPFGKGTASNVVSGVPGGNHDEDEEDIVKPTTITGLTLAAVNKINTDGKNVTNIKAKWTKLTETDIDSHNFEWRSTEDLSAATPPTPDQVEHGNDGSFVGENWVDGSNTVEGDIKEGKKDGEVSNRNYTILKAVTHNMKYFGRVQGVNTGEQFGTWSAWASIVITKAAGNTDTTAPGTPTLSLSAKTESIELTASLASPPADLAGFRFAVKSTSDFSGDETSYIHASIDSTDGKAKVTFFGTSGTTYYIKAQSYDNSKNYSAWSASQSSSPSSATVSELSKAYSLWKYKGGVSSSANNKISFTGGSGNELVKKRNSGTEKSYTVTAQTDQTVTGTMYIVVDALNDGASTATFKLVNASGLAAESDPVVVARVEQTSASKCNILRYLNDDKYSVSAYQGGFNNLSALFLDANNATLGALVMKHDSGTSLKMKDSSDNVAIRLRVNNSAEPDLIIMKSGHDADTGSNDTDPAKVAFSSKLVIGGNTIRPSYPKIIAEGLQSCTWADETVNAGSTRSDMVEITTPAPLAIYFTAQTYIGNPTGGVPTRPLEWSDVYYIDGTGHFEARYRAYYYPATGKIEVERYMINTTNTNRSTGSITYNVRWILYSDKTE